MNIRNIKYVSNYQVVTMNVNEQVVMYRYNSSANIYTWISIYNVVNFHSNRSFKFFKI